MKVESKILHHAMIEFFLFVEAFDNFIHTKLAESFLIS
jgi:hypothetical protein